MRFLKRLTALLMAAGFFVSGNFMAVAAPKDIISRAVSETAAYLLKTVTEPQAASIGGEWTVIGLARSGYDVPQSYWDKYYKAVEKYVTGFEGQIHDKKITEYSRLILALTAIGRDPSNVGGYNLLDALGDFDKTIWQGINGPIFALIALDSGNYGIPVNPAAKTQATREMYIDEILSRQTTDGGFALSGDKADADITGMALQALAKYRDRKGVEAAVNKGLSALSALQDSSGGYEGNGADNSESTAQVLMALCELGIDPEDARFIKNGNSPADNLLSYYKRGQGFVHRADGSGGNLMATEQAFYALVNLERITSGKSSLYRMTEPQAELGGIAPPSPENTDTSQCLQKMGLSGKNGDVKIPVIINPDKTFADIKGHVNQEAVEALASMGIISGVSDNGYAPDKTVTRAEFAAMVVNALGLAPRIAVKFNDVQEEDWYAPYVGTAYSYGVINGKSPDSFEPDSAITKQEAAVMLSNAAKLCGMDTELENIEIRDMLAQFADYTTSAQWARGGLAFCYGESIFSQEDMEIQPQKSVTRGETAEALYHMLRAAELI